MNGLHLSSEFHACRAQPSLLTDADALCIEANDAALACGLNVVGELFHTFAPPGGVTGVLLLAESHLALHTWPELAAVTLDVYVCNRSGDHSSAARALMAAMELLFRPERIESRAVSRGALAPR